MSQTPPPPGGTGEPGDSGEPGAGPSGPNPYGQAPYGQNPYAQNPYAQAPYGQAPYGQAPYGQNPYAPGSGAPEGGKGLAIAALVLAFIPTCLTQIAAIVMAIVVLAGRRAGRGLAVAAIIVAVVMTVVVFAGLAVLGNLAGETVGNLERGQCVTADGLTDPESDSVSRVQVVECTEPHDGEVLATTDLTAEEAASYEGADARATCRRYVDRAVLQSLPGNVDLTTLTQSATPEEGDRLLCVAFPIDGSQLTEPLG